MKEPRPISRGEFLRISGTALAGTVLPNFSKVLAGIGQPDARAATAPAVARPEFAWPLAEGVTLGTDIYNPDVTTSVSISGGNVVLKVSNQHESSPGLLLGMQSFTNEQAQTYFKSPQDVLDLITGKGIAQTQEAKGVGFDNSLLVIKLRQNLPGGNYYDFFRILSAEKPSWTRKFVATPQVPPGISMVEGQVLTRQLFDDPNLTGDTDEANWETQVLALAPNMLFLAARHREHGAQAAGFFVLKDNHWELYSKPSLHLDNRHARHKYSFRQENGMVVGTDTITNLDVLDKLGIENSSKDVILHIPIHDRLEALRPLEFKNGELFKSAPQEKMISALGSDTYCYAKENPLTGGFNFAIGKANYWGKIVATDEWGTIDYKGVQVIGVKAFSYSEKAGFCTVTYIDRHGKSQLAFFHVISGKIIQASIQESPLGEVWGFRRPWETRDGTFAQLRFFEEGAGLKDKSIHAPLVKPTR